MTKKEHMETDTPTKLYELSYILVSTVPEDKLSEEVATIKTAIEGVGGVVQTSADPSLRDLAYPMSLSKEHKKTTYTAGYFGWMVFEGYSDATKKLEKVMDGNERVLRYLLINRPPLAVASVKAKAPGVGPRNEKKDVNEEDIEKSIDEMVEEKAAA